MAATETAPLIDLPTELIIHVVSYLENKHDLSNVAKVCRALREPAQRCLFHTVDLVRPRAATPYQSDDDEDWRYAKDDEDLELRWWLLSPRLPPTEIDDDEDLQETDDDEEQQETDDEEEQRETDDEEEQQETDDEEEQQETDDEEEQQETDDEEEPQQEDTSEEAPYIFRFLSESKAKPVIRRSIRKLSIEHWSSRQYSLSEYAGLSSTSKDCEYARETMIEENWPFEEAQSHLDRPNTDASTAKLLALLPRLESLQIVFRKHLFGYGPFSEHGLVDDADFREEEDELQYLEKYSSLTERRIEKMVAKSSCSEVTGMLRSLTLSGEPPRHQLVYLHQLSVFMTIPTLREIKVENIVMASLRTRWACPHRTSTVSAISLSATSVQDDILTRLVLSCRVLRSFSLESKYMTIKDTTVPFATGHFYQALQTHKDTIKYLRLLSGRQYYECGIMPPTIPMTAFTRFAKLEDFGTYSFAIFSPPDEDDGHTLEQKLPPSLKTLRIYEDLYWPNVWNEARMNTILYVLEARPNMRIVFNDVPSHRLESFSLLLDNDCIATEVHSAGPKGVWLQTISFRFVS